MVELEGKGLDYERYALRKLFQRLVTIYKIKSVLEIPAKGEKSMPSIYSLGFAEAGCRVTLVNAEEKSKKAWKELGFNVSYIECEDLSHTEIKAEQFDLVWNFLYLAHSHEKDDYLNEMRRLSKKYILFISVNKFNPGFYSHKMIHKIFNIPWNHGDVEFMNSFYVSDYFKDNGLKLVKKGVVDTPPYPDSLGFRDMKLHRKNADLNEIDWESHTVQWMKAGKYPLKIKFLYLFECLPMPFIIKLLYAHLFYVIAEK